MNFKEGTYHTEYSHNGHGVSLEYLKRPIFLGFTLIRTLLEQISADYTFDYENGFKLVFDFVPKVSRAHADLSHLKF